MNDPTDTPDYIAVRSQKLAAANERARCAAIQRRAALAEDTEWLLATGEWIGRIPQRLGVTPAALEKALRRGCRPDLATLFDQRRGAL